MTTDGGERDRRRDRFRGALVGVVVGDAVGAPFEGQTTDPSARVEAALDRIRPPAGVLRFTDDTAMTFALAGSLLDRGGLDPAHLSETFAATYRADPHRGYGQSPGTVFSLIDQGVDWREAPRMLFGGEGSAGDGAAMRVAPVALAASGDRPRLVDWARQQALVTHAHPLGVDGAVAQAVAVSVALESGRVERDDVIGEVREASATDELSARLDGMEAVPAAAPVRVVAERIGNGFTAQEAVPAALYAALRHPRSVIDAVQFAIRLGGDTDTIASMAAAIVGAAVGASSIEQVWRDAAEGVAQAERLADDLLDLSLGSID